MCKSLHFVIFLTLLFVPLTAVTCVLLTLITVEGFGSKAGFVVVFCCLMRTLLPILMFLWTHLFGIIFPCCIVCIGVSVPSPLRNTTPSFLPSTFLKSENCPSPLFRQPSPYILFFCEHPPYKMDFLVNLKNIKVFHSYPHLLKVTKFLVKILQFEFLVLTENSIFVYKPFLSLNISDFIFYVKIAIPFPEKSYPLFPSNPSLKTEVLSSSTFLKIG